MITYRQLIERSKKILAVDNLPTNALYAILLDKANLTYEELLLNLDKEISDKLLEDFSEAFSEYIVDEKPVAYILGYIYFYGMKFFVDKRVLIPRKETEEVVEEALKVLKDKENLKIVDLGCGSGNIAITLAKHLKNAEVYAVDISVDAIEVAKRNAINNDVKVNFIIMDMIDFLKNNKEKFDVIISNPPYISKNYKLASSVLNFEPPLALIAEDEGMFYYNKIFKYVNNSLNKNGYLILEIGYDQKSKIEKLVKDYFKDAKAYIKKDLGGNDRIVVIEK